MDYNERKRLLLNGMQHIGREMQGSHQWPRLSPAQARHVRGKNIMTNEIWQYRLLAGGALLVEISYSWFLDHPLYGLTVYCVGPLAGDAEAWDHALSGALFSEGDVVARLNELNEGGRDRIAALAEAAA